MKRSWVFRQRASNNYVQMRSLLLKHALVIFCIRVTLLRQAGVEGSLQRALRSSGSRYNLSRS